MQRTPRKFLGSHILIKRALLSVTLTTVVMLVVACGRSEPAPRFEIGDRTCADVWGAFTAQVVDDATGSAINGTYWRSETLRGEILLELEEDFEPERRERYMLVSPGSVINERLREAAKVSASSHPTSFGSASEDFRVVVAKEGYVTIVRELTATGDICRIQEVDGDTEFRMVKGPPGPDDVFRNPR